MNKNAFAAFFGVCAILLSGESTTFSQALSGSSLSVSGTGTIEVLNSGTGTIGVLTSSTANLNVLNIASSASLQGGLIVSGTVDLQGDNFCFGSWLSDPAMAGVMFTYTDAVTTPAAMPSRLTLWAMQPSHEWLWVHSTADQTSTVPMMKLDANHVLTLYDTSGGPSIVLDPATSGGGPVLTLQAADSRYVSNTDVMVSWNTDDWGDSSPSIAFPEGTATGPYAVAGIRATASGHGSLAIGDLSIASGLDSAAIGCYSNASEAYATASGVGSMASGVSSTASADSSTASGFGAVASGFYSMAIGMCSVASGPYSKAIGDFSTATGDITTAGYGQFVVGRGNIPQGDLYRWNPVDDLFVVGNGAHLLDSDGYPVCDENGNFLYDASNAFVVKKNGDTTVYGKLTISGSNGSTAATPSGFCIAYDSVMETTSISGNTKLTGALVVTGTTDGNGIVVASGSTQLVLIPQQGDLLMGDFHRGAQPVGADSSQMTQNVQNLATPQALVASQSSTGIIPDRAAMQAALISRRKAIRNSALNVSTSSSGTAAMASGTSQIR